MSEAEVVDLTTGGESGLKMHVPWSLLQTYSSKDWCQFFMAIWVWLRSVNVWSTLFLSAFHLQTLRRVAPVVGNIHGSRGAPKILLINLFLVWFMNLIYSIPAYVFSTSGNINSTEVRLLQLNDALAFILVELLYTLYLSSIT